MSFQSNEPRILDGDSDLVTRLIQSDEAAFKALYDKYNGRLYHHLLRFTRSSEQAEDILQDVFVRLWENRTQLRKDTSFVAYLFTIAKHHLFNVLKRSARAKVINKELFSVHPTQNTTEESVQVAEYEAIFHRAVAQLPQQRQLIFRLCRFEGRSYEEVSQQLGITKGTVNSQMVKAIRDIKQFVGRYEEVSLLLVYIFW